VRDARKRAPHSIRIHDYRHGRTSIESSGNLVIE